MCDHDAVEQLLTINSTVVGSMHNRGKAFLIPDSKQAHQQAKRNK